MNRMSCAQEHEQVNNATHDELFEPALSLLARPHENRNLVLRSASRLITENVLLDNANTRRPLLLLS
jgi:hypothetical protein